jgi:ribose transport system ATP-binding protein
MMAKRSSGETSKANKGPLMQPLKKSAIRAKNLTLTSGAKPLDFEIAEGEIIGVTGLDGQGQDIFIRVLAGIWTASSGCPFVTSENNNLVSLNSLEDADRLGVVYVSGDRKREGIFSNLSIYENIAIGIYRHYLRLSGWIDYKSITEKFWVEVKRLKIKIGKKTDKITSLSGGNQQKVLIGRALAADPKILVLNDPTRGVDIGTKKELYKNLMKFAGQGGSVIFLSSEIEEFLGVANGVAVFRDGTIFSIISGKDITTDNILAAMFGQKDQISLGLNNEK